MRRSTELAFVDDRRIATRVAERRAGLFDNERAKASVRRLLGEAMP
ncbi:MAG: hypothetical protein IPG50_36035 [Myxococcales bacterium]|nr:hypothetical protein [Myxococcales bacterium]